MKRTVVWSLLTLIVLGGAFLKHTQSAFSSPSIPSVAPPTIINVNSTADIFSPGAGVVTLRSAIAAANADLTANLVVINLQPATTYALTLANATQENSDVTCLYDHVQGD